MTPSLAMAMWMGLVAAVMASGGASPWTMVVLMVCSVSASLEAGSADDHAAVPGRFRRTVRIVAFSSFLASTAWEAYRGTILFLR